MELISRQAVLNGIDKYIEKAQSTGTKDDFISFEELVVKALPSAFEGMTNGEVMKAVFPNALRSDYIENDMLILYLQDENESEMVVPEDWWNAPYQKGG